MTITSTGPGATALSLLSGATRSGLQLDQLPRAYRWGLRAGEGLLLAIGLLALAGWFADLPRLASVDPSWIPVAPNTALSLVLCAVSLWALRGARPRLAVAAIAVVGLLSLVRLGEYWFGLDPTVDRWLFRFTAGNLGLAPVGRMALFTAFDFTIASAALGLLAWPRAPRVAHLAASLAGAVVGGSGLTVALAYAYRSPLGYQGDHIPMALPTALGFLLLGAELVLLGGRQAVLERRYMEAELRASERLFRAVFVSAPIGVAVLDGDGRLLVANPEMSRLLLSLGVSGAGALTDALAPAGRGGIAAALASERRASEVPLLSTEVALATGDRWAVLQLLAIGESRGCELLALLRETTEERQAHAVLTEAREVLEERVRARTAELEARNREQQEFAYLASHDLQEPLRKVLAFGDRLDERYGEQLGEEGRDYLRRMREAAARMRRLIDDLLTFSRVTTHTRRFATVELDRVAREALSDLEVRLEESGGRVELSPLGRLEADADQMRQLLQNLLANALKYHPPGEAPRVRVWSEAEVAPMPRLRLLVADQGIGFDERYLDRIFAPFQRLHGRGEYEGTGIGLAVCRRIVERHGGTITARSAPGQGATFVVTLPLRQAADSSFAATTIAESEATPPAEAPIAEGNPA